MRYAARCAYTLAHEEMDLVELAQLEEFAGVGLARLQEWADEDDWDGQRLVASDRAKRLAQVRLREGLIRQGQRQMTMLAHLHDEAALLRRQQAVQPKSWESVANVQLKAAALMQQWHKDNVELMAKLVAPAAATAQAEGDNLGIGFDAATVADWSQSDAQEVAHHVLRQRLKARLSPPAESDDAAEDDDRPPAEPVPLKSAIGR